MNGKDGAKGDKGDSGISEEARVELENKIEESQEHFVSVNTVGNKNEGNYDNSGASGKGSIAIGVSAKSTGKDSVSVGSGSTVTGNSSISVGTKNTVSGNMSGAIGDPSIIGGDSSYSLGNDNVIGNTSNNVSVVGSNVKVGATGASIVDGTPVFTGVNDASNSVAIGESVNVQATDAVAIGANSSVTHTNSVALGAGSQTSAANTVSVGNAETQRRITNVAAGINPNDAVNVSQLNQNRAEAFGYTDRRINDLEGETHSAVAGALAFGALRYPNVPGKVSVGLGGGTWEGETGYALGVGYTTSDGQLSISSAFGGSGSQNGGNVGVSYTFN
nr:YadA-like family protein [Psychrobacter alimentarius]